MSTVKTVCRAAMVGIAVMALATLATAVVHASGDDGQAPAAMQAAGGALGSGAPYLAIALVMGSACLSAAYAVGKVGAAALGAAAEKPELLGKAIVFVGLGEGIAIFGLIISLMLINKI